MASPDWAGHAGGESLLAGHLREWALIGPDTEEAVGGGVKRVAAPRPRRKPGALSPHQGPEPSVPRHGSPPLPSPRSPAPGWLPVPPAAGRPGASDWTSSPGGPG